MRAILREKRLKRKMTQRDVAESVGISLRLYQHLEQGTAVGSVATWDKLEDLFKTRQQRLRENIQNPDNYKPGRPPVKNKK
jgi:Uncharacterized protein conserved in bacteria